MTDPTNVTGPRRSLRVIASSDAPILVEGDGVEVRLRIDHAAIVALASEQAVHAGDASVFRFYLELEQVRGTHDAAVLQMFLRTPGATQASHPHDTYLASVGLFGLRLASMGDAGEGLFYSLDITSHAARLQHAAVPAAARLCVSIQSRHTLPGGVGIHIGRVSICVERINA
ncbi:DUF7868 domain-containing protein [Burkholderia lata]|uniref:DUF7868 domain-containing protein n=1 Tax=Burkholderia lata (strain ATCC 17760 / DSM 23089 / LMG 22485 / NCIMB 9086 / R18194 / 383) TaxID=482957 RepID=UPI0014546324|nr:hypothetical protein [Burkholderia lata]VWB69222.1 hypothetical protein BLA15816_03279 [Burkholderia lata]